ncbi:MAG: hypothetical protein KatS3mg115_0953 [Candidatus Poribacteria bacterium]|nr:MAG: hypothetical protein KatS3mg115_0953 [Candidatus Poribacteria bacterium]
MSAPPRMASARLGSRPGIRFRSWTVRAAYWGDLPFYLLNGQAEPVKPYLGLREGVSLAESHVGQRDDRSGDANEEALRKRELHRSERLAGG